MNRKRKKKSEREKKEKKEKRKRARQPVAVFFLFTFFSFHLLVAGKATSSSLAPSLPARLASKGRGGSLRVDAMSVIRPPPAGEDDRAADGTKAAAGNACGAADSSGCRQSFSSPLPAPAPFEPADAAALVFSLAAAALAARLSPLIALVVFAEGGFYLWQRYR